MEASMSQRREQVMMLNTVSYNNYVNSGELSGELRPDAQKTQPEETEGSSKTLKLLLENQNDQALVKEISQIVTRMDLLATNPMTFDSPDQELADS